MGHWIVKQRQTIVRLACNNWYKWACRVNKSSCFYGMSKQSIGFLELIVFNVVFPLFLCLLLCLSFYLSVQDLPLWGRQRVPADNALPLHRKPELCAPVVSQPVDQILGHSLLWTLQVWLCHGDEAQTPTQGRAFRPILHHHRMPGPAVVASCFSLCHPSLPPVGEAPHVEEWEEEDLLLRDVSRRSDSVHAVVRLCPGQEDCRGDQTREKRSVAPTPSFTPFTLYHTAESSQAYQLLLLTYSAMIRFRWLPSIIRQAQSVDF